MPTRRQSKPDILAIPNYGPIEAAEFLHIPYETLRYWMSPKSGPLIRPAEDGRQQILSFKNLVECYVLDIIRRIHKVSMPKVRFSVETIRRLQDARHLMNTEYPLADHDLKIDKKAKRLYVYDLHGKIVQLTDGGTIEAPEFVEACLQRVVRDKGGVAQKFHPFLRQYDSLEKSARDPQLLIVDPRVSFGKPVIAGTGITTEVIAGRLIAGDIESDLAKEYGRTLAEIRAAAKFENVPTAA
jgi:uncharacterized protein (DUF433 family)